MFLPHEGEGFVEGHAFVAGLTFGNGLLHRSQTLLILAQRLQRRTEQVVLAVVAARGHLRVTRLA